VVDEKDFQKRVQKIGELVQQLESIGDAASRAAAKELVQLLMDMHGASLERLLEVIFESGEPGGQIIDRLGRDPLVSSLLILYGIHPEDLQTRVERKLAQIASKLQKMGADASLIDAKDGNVVVRIKVDGHACGSTARTVQATVEEAIYEAAPDLKSLLVEGAEEKPATGFVALDKLLAGPTHPAVPNAASVTHGGISEGMD